MPLPPAEPARRIVQASYTLSLKTFPVFAADAKIARSLAPQFPSTPSPSSSDNNQVPQPKRCFMPRVPCFVLPAAIVSTAAGGFASGLPIEDQIAIQVALDRAGFSPGLIDGK